MGIRSHVGTHFFMFPWREIAFLTSVSYFWLMLTFRLEIPKPHPNSSKISLDADYYFDLWFPAIFEFRLSFPSCRNVQRTSRCFRCNTLEAWFPTVEWRPFCLQRQFSCFWLLTPWQSWQYCLWDSFGGSHSFFRRSCTFRSWTHHKWTRSLTLFWPWSEVRWTETAVWSVQRTSLPKSPHYFLRTC